MRCETCPHMKAIRAALSPCQSCDEGSHHGVSHVQATDFTLAQRKMDDHTPTTGVTRLSPDDEDRLRKAMSSLFALNPLDLLLVQHLFHGLHLAEFGSTMNRLHRRIHHYAPSATRSMAHAKKNAIVRIFPQIKDVFKHVIDPKKPTVRDPDRIDDLI